MIRNLLYKVVIFGFLVAMVSCRKNLVTGPHGGSNEEEPVPVRIIEVDPPVLTPEKHQVTENIFGYYSGLPAHYNETDYRYPLMIFFHGGGQYGDGDTALVKVLKEGVPKLLDQKTFPPSFTVGGQNFSFVIIAPQLKRFIQPDEVGQLIDYAVANYRIDSSRIYLVGFSLGAQQLSNYAGEHPSRIAALTAMAGTPYMDDSLESKCRAMVAAKLPIWHVHNVDDQAWPYSEAVKFDSVLNSFNPEIIPRFTTFDVGQGKSNHDCWTRTMDPSYKENGKNIYEWMLSYSR